MLVVIEPFSLYQRGDRITDAGLIEAVLTTEDARSVIVVGTPGTATPTPAQRTLLEILADLADNDQGGGSAPKPQLIDALPDVDGNPPAGYEWLAGHAPLHNYSCSAQDSMGGMPMPNPIPCATGFAGSMWNVGNPTMLVIANRSATDQTLVLNVATPTDAQQVMLVGIELLSDVSALVIYKQQAADGSWTLNSGISNVDGSFSNAASIVLEQPFLVQPQAVANLNGYFVQAFPVAGYVFINIVTGALALGATSDQPFGVIIASDSSGVYCAYGSDPVLSYIPLVLTVVDDVPTIQNGLPVAVMPIPGGSVGNLFSPYLPIGAARLPSGQLAVCTRAGFFEIKATVLNDDATVSVKQTAGVHPLVKLDFSGAQTDVQWMRHNGQNGMLHTLSLAGETVIDYTTLKSMFIRKARLITPA